MDFPPRQKVEEERYVASPRRSLWIQIAARYPCNSAARDLPPEDVPVMAILKKYREMAGAHGRMPHKAAPSVCPDLSLVAEEIEMCDVGEE